MAHVAAPLEAKMGAAAIANADEVKQLAHDCTSMPAINDIHYVFE